MALEHVEDHAAQAQGRLASQYRDTTVEGFVLAPVPGQQAVEDALWQTLQVPVIDSAEGEQLDLLGRIVGEPRYSRDDATYRLWLKARVAINKSNGTVAELLYIVGLIKPADASLRLVPSYPASLNLHLDDIEVTASDAAIIAAVLQEAKAAGVRAIVEFLNSSPEDAFTLDDGPGLDTGELAGAVE